MYIFFIDIDIDIVIYVMYNMYMYIYVCILYIIYRIITICQLCHQENGFMVSGAIETRCTWDKQYIYASHLSRSQ